MLYLLSTYQKINHIHPRFLHDPCLASMKFTLKSPFILQAHIGLFDPLGTYYHVNTLEG